MNTRTLILRSLGYYWRTHLGVVLGVALAALVLTGSLMVGDSVKATLRQQSEVRVGRAGEALISDERFLQVPAKLEDAGGAAVLMVRGMVERVDGGARTNLAQIAGVEKHFWRLSPSGRIKTIPADGVILNTRLAAQLAVSAGDAVVLRIERPSLLSKDAPLSGAEDLPITLRAQVAEIVGEEDFGRFALSASQVPPATAFVPREVLQSRLGQAGRANLFLGQAGTTALSAWSQAPLSFADASLELRTTPGDSGIELRSSRIFLEPEIVQAAREHERADQTLHARPGVDSLTYFVNELRAGDGSDPKAPSTPYSMVTALDAPASGFLAAELEHDEIQITRWLADDLGVNPGGQMTLKYFAVGDRRELVEKTRTFKVLGPILEMDEPHLNPSWMPDFPNVPDKDGLKTWKPGFPFAAERIRKKDEDYWAAHRGTPKAFVNLRVGQEMWGNRWGNLTSIRYPAGITNEQLSGIMQRVTAATIGFQRIDLRQSLETATNAPVDFGQLFASFSFFLVVAAVVLTGLLFTFSIEQRAAEAGLLLALGWRAGAVRNLFLREGLLLAAIGSVIGVAAASGYTVLVLRALGGVWSGATGSTQFIFSLSPVTLGIGLASGVLVSLLAMWLASRRLFRRNAAELLAGGGGANAPVAAGNARFWVPGVLLLLAVGLAVAARGNPGAFFGAGALLLIAGLLFSRALLRRVAQGTDLESLPQLGARNTSRRTGRSLATISVLASGVFMVVAVDSFRKGPLDDPTRRDSGTGGFMLVGESAAPIYEDLNSPKGREQYALDDEILRDVEIVPMRVREGDDASCLNLNRAVQPKLLGVRPADLAGRFSFNAPKSAGWNLAENGGVVDANTLQWAMQKKIGDELVYPSGTGTEIKVPISATVSGSMLQGLVLISEEQFVRSFPNASGYRFFLVDCPPAKALQVREHLSQQLGDRGLELVSAAQRLEDFNAVENTYLSIFQALGALGLLLGSAGLGIVVARNVLERRREFGLLEAVGFNHGQLRALVFAEHRWLILGAVVIGALSALLAVAPQMAQKAGAFPWGQLAVLFGGMAAIGAACAWVAARLALRGSQLAALRSE